MFYRNAFFPYPILLFAYEVLVNIWYHFNSNNTFFLNSSYANTLFYKAASSKKYINLSTYSGLKRRENWGHKDTSCGLFLETYRKSDGGRSGDDRLKERKKKKKVQQICWIWRWTQIRAGWLRGRFYCIILHFPLGTLSISLASPQ